MRREQAMAGGLLRRYREAWAAAWAKRRELAGPRRLTDEAAFLPAAMSLQEAPVHPAPRRAIWAVMLFLTLALIWACVGKVDIIAVAPGRIVVSDGTKVIQPLESGIVTAIHVRDGSRVQAGQVLVELDRTMATAERRSVQERADATDSERRRVQALLTAIEGLDERGSLPATSSPPSPRLPDAHAEAEWADIAARVRRIDAEVARRKAELATASEILAKLQATLPIARQREADVTALASQGFMASHAVQDRTRERVELERDLAAQLARVAEVEAALAESMQARVAQLMEARRTIRERLTRAGVEQAQLLQEHTKAAHRERITQLRSPVSGTVQQLSVRTTGGVVTPAQPLMVVVPDKAEIIAEIAIDNKDIGFVRIGQDVAVKLEAFNFTRYGTVPAVLTRVSADAVTDEAKGTVFVAGLKLLSNALLVDNANVPLVPGMNITAEVRTGERRLIEFLLSPIQQQISASARER